MLIRGDQSIVKWPDGAPDDSVAQAAIGVCPFEWHGITRGSSGRSLWSSSMRRAAGCTRRFGPAAFPSSTGLQGRVLLRGASLRKDQCPRLSEVAALPSQPADRPLVSRAVQTFPRTLRRAKACIARSSRHVSGIGDVPFAHRTNLIPWQEVSGRSGELKRFFEAACPKPAADSGPDRSGQT